MHIDTLRLCFEQRKKDVDISPNGTTFEAGPHGLDGWFFGRMQKQYMGMRSIGRRALFI